MGQIRGQEIDFVAERGAERLYVQVCYILANEQVIEREFHNLTIIRDNYTKYVISLDDMTLNNYQGIKHVQAWDFLS